jgi:RimJ/RimL family protein N-acetyltransferase
MRRLPPEWARVLANVDHDRRMAIAALGPADELIAVARYTHDDRADEAEVAIVVQDAWQNRGIGTVLLPELLAYGERRGIRRFRAYVLAENTRMLDLLTRVSRVLERRLEGGVVSLLVTRDAEAAPR